MKMKLWHISANAGAEYDSYDSAVVAALSADAALMYPGGNEPSSTWRGRTWVAVDMSHCVTVRYIGEAVASTPAGVICASFNAG